MLFSPRARRCGTSQTLPVSDGLARKPISDYVVCIVAVMFKECLGSVVAPCVAVSWLDGCRCIWCVCHIGWLARGFCCLCQPGPQQRFYTCQTDAGGRAMACRDCCGHWQVFQNLIPRCLSCSPTSMSMGTGTPEVSSSRGSPERVNPAPDPLYILLSVHNTESNDPYNKSPINLLPSSLLASTLCHPSSVPLNYSPYIHCFFPLSGSLYKSVLSMPQLKLPVLQLPVA
jgi:hypothetical protein